MWADWDDHIEKLFLKQARGILLRCEVVDLSLGRLTYEGRFDRVEPLLRRLLAEQLGD